MPHGELSKKTHFPCISLCTFNVLILDLFIFSSCRLWFFFCCFFHFFAVCKSAACSFVRKSPSHLPYIPLLGIAFSFSLRSFVGKSPFRLPYVALLCLSVLFLFLFVDRRACSTSLCLAILEWARQRSLSDSAVLSETAPLAFPSQPLVSLCMCVFMCANGRC